MCSGDPGAVRAVLRDGLNIPALQDLRRERQRHQNRALRTSTVHSLPHPLAGQTLRKRNKGEGESLVIIATPWRNEMLVHS